MIEKIIGKTNTIFTSINSITSFFNELSIKLYVGIDDTQSLIIEIYDGDKQGVNDGYLLQVYETPIYRIFTSKYNIFTMNVPSLTISDEMVKNNFSFIKSYKDLSNKIYKFDN